MIFDERTDRMIFRHHIGPQTALENRVEKALREIIKDDEWLRDIYKVRCSCVGDEVTIMAIYS